MIPTCPCGSQHVYSQCCGKYIEENVFAPNPEALMRSRYTAFVLGKVAYIGETMRGKAAKHFDPNETKAWTESVQWQGLSVIKSKLKTPKKGTVTFEARYIHQGKAHILREKSEFQKLGDRWYYTEGRALLSLE